MANYFESFSIKLVHKGCTDSSAYNYDSAATEALKTKTFFDAYKEALKEKNSVKIEIYKEKLADLCNCKTC